MRCWSISGLSLALSSPLLITMITNEPAECLRSGGETVENSDAQRMLCGEKFSIALRKCKCKVRRVASYTHIRTCVHEVTRKFLAIVSIFNIYLYATKISWWKNHWWHGHRFEEFKLEVNRWRRRWSIREPTGDPLPQTLVETLDVANAAFYPGAYVAVKTRLDVSCGGMSCGAQL